MISAAIADGWSLVVPAQHVDGKVIEIVMSSRYTHRVTLEAILEFKDKVIYFEADFGS